MIAPLLAAATMSIGVQDQGADPATLNAAADQLGATTVRYVTTTRSPLLDLVTEARARGHHVQVAVVVKRTTSPGEFRPLLRAWAGRVESVSVGNEPELNGVPPCTYARLYAKTRRMIKREFPGIAIGFGEFSPAAPLEYLSQISKCRVSIRADFAAIHPYQFFSDPLGPPTERSGVGTWVGLGNLWKFRRALRAVGSPPLRCTEFAYLTTGRYATNRAAWLWPRAIKQAKRYCKQFIFYGFGPVGGGSWGSAGLLDGDGYSLPPLEALTRALGKHPFIARRPNAQSQDVPQSPPDPGDAQAPHPHEERVLGSGSEESQPIPDGGVSGEDTPDPGPSTPEQPPVPASDDPVREGGDE